MSVGDTKQVSGRVLSQWNELRQFTGDAGVFLPAFLSRVARLCNATAASLFVRPRKTAAAPNDGGATRWRCALSHPSGRQPLAKLQAERLDAIEAVARVEQFFAAPLVPGSFDDIGLAIIVPGIDENQSALLVLQLDERSRSSASELGLRLNLAAAVPHLYQSQRRLRQAKAEVSRFASCLDLMSLVNAESKFISAAMLLCNELVTRFKCNRVSMGWLEGNYVEVKAISHTEKFEKKMEAIQLLAAAMEEAVDQSEEIVYPRPEDALYLTRDHQTFAKEQNPGCIATLPILTPRLEEDDEDDTETLAGAAVVGAITFERTNPEFSASEIASLRIICDQAARTLTELHEGDRWFGRRAAAWLRKKAAKLIGVEHTWLKLLGIALAIGVAVLVFGKKEYKVEAPFALETDSIAFLSAPFEGYLDEAFIKVGERVDEGNALFTLDTRELLIEKQAALAEKKRYVGEAAQAESVDDVAGMNIARARYDQAQANLEMVEFHLSQASIKAPFDGVVVEGDLDERINAPVEQGEVLMKIARITGMYPELNIPEEDIHEIVEEATGMMAFASRPEEKFPVVVERIEPVARTEEGGNVFIIRCRLEGEQPDWWRPGMTGIAKVNAGKRNLFWIMSHRTVDQVRMWLW